MRDSRRILVFAATALTLCLPGCRRGDGVDRIAADAENHDFLLDLPGRRVIHIAGAYPRKTYLCSQAFPGGRKRSFRLPGYSLTGRPFLLRDGRTVLIAAKHYGDEHSEGVSTELLLRVDLEAGEILRAYELPDGAVIRAFAQPRWSPAPVIAIQDGTVARIARLDARTDLKTGGIRLAAVLGGEMAIAEDYPTIAAVALDRLGAGALRLFEAGSGRKGREVGLQSPRHLEARGSGHWLVTVEDANGGGVVVDFNDSLQKVRTLLSTPGRVESVVLGDRWLYAIALAPQVRSAATKAWVRPRELHRVDLTGADRSRTFPWTEREGALLGLDEVAGRLYFAVTDQDDAAVWSIPTDVRVLERLGPDIDRPVRATSGQVYLAVFGALVAAFVVGLAYVLTSEPGV
ncbi:MAG: hypothetical protein HY924_06415 [Elusimicrobia bacterium]|nr:hypothetical protein [Elusimicrobiota bacterium]